jgi:hypothetical protein
MASTLLALFRIALDFGNMPKRKTFSRFGMCNQKNWRGSNMIGKKTAVIASAALALAMTAFAAIAANDFSGTWQVKDTDGTPFDIVLSDDGKASANRAGEGMSGTWKEDGDAAVITWSEGWTTKIAKEGDGYTKQAWGKGKSMDDAPTNPSDATKK